MKLLAAFIMVGLTLFSQASADVPECEQEEVEKFWDDAIPRVFDAIGAHIRDYRRLGSKYEGYPDLACFTKLYLSHGGPSEIELRRRVIRLLDFEVEAVYRDLVDNSGDPSTFFFEEFFEEVLCVAQKLGRVRVDNAVCDNAMAKAVAIIESIRYEAEKDIRAKEEAERKQKQAEEERLAEEERKNKEKKRLAKEKRQKAEQEKRKEDERKRAEAERKRREEQRRQAEAEKERKEEEEKKRRKELAKIDPKYQPLFRKGTAADEAYCRQAYSDQSRWPIELDDRGNKKYADPDKQVDLDHCWDLASIGGHYLYGQPSSQEDAEKLKKKLKGQFNSWYLLVRPTKVGFYFPGRALRVGRGTRIKLLESIEFYRRSARRGSSKAQYFMGMFYAEGHGVAKDYREAEKWLRESVKNNDADAKAYLGYLLEFGKGLDRNLVEAKRLYREAAKAGHRFARERLSN